jgi:hypothetical protein
MDVEFRPNRALTISDIPSPAVPGRLYFVVSEKKMYIGLSNGTVEEYGGSGGGASLVDTLAGNEHDKAPSVNAVNGGLDGKADLVNGKVDPSQLPPGATLYRGAFVDAAALAAAYPTDTPGAYASVVATTSIWLWDDDTGAWVDSGITGIFVESVNGKVGPIVSIDAPDVGAAPIAHVSDYDLHLETGERAFLDGLPQELQDLAAASGFNKIKVGAVIID